MDKLYCFQLRQESLLNIISFHPGVYHKSVRYKAIAKGIEMLLHVVKNKNII